MRRIQRIQINQVELDPISFDDAVEHVSALLKGEPVQAHHVVTVNAQFVQIARDDPRFAELIRGADLSVADGVPLVWASRLLGCPLPARVNGTNLMLALCERAARDGDTVYFLGGKPGSAESAALQLQQRFPGLEITGINCPPLGFTESPAVDAAVCERIEAARPDLLFVGLGAPKQEFWIQRHTHLPAKVMLGIGGSFELLGGVTRRAPRLLQNIGMEWLWRLVMEPRRLWKRYLVGNSLFVYLVLRQKLTRRPVPCDGRA